MSSLIFLLLLLNVSLADNQGHVYHEVSSAHFHMQDQSPAIELHATRDGVHIRTRPASLDVSSKMPQSRSHQNRYRSRSRGGGYGYGSYGNRFRPTHKGYKEDRQRKWGSNENDPSHNDGDDGERSQFRLGHESDDYSSEDRRGAGDWANNNKDFRDFDERNVEESRDGGWRNPNRGDDADKRGNDKGDGERRGASNGQTQRIVSGIDIHAIPPIRRHPVDPIKLDGSMFTPLHHFRGGYNIFGYRKHGPPSRHLHHRRHSHHLRHIPYRRDQLHLDPFGMDIHSRDALITTDSSIGNARTMLPGPTVDAPGIPGPFTSEPFPIDEDPEHTTDQIAVSPFLPRSFADRMPATVPLVQAFYQSSVAPSTFASNYARPVAGIRHTSQRRPLIYESSPVVGTTRQREDTGNYKLAPTESDPVSSSFGQSFYQTAPSYKNIRNSNERIAKMLMGFPYADAEEHFPCSFHDCFSKAGHEMDVDVAVKNDNRQKNGDDDDDDDSDSDDDDNSDYGG